MRRGRVLAVDDEPYNLMILEELLGNTYDLRCAAGGEEAIAAAREFRPDLILLDIMMKGIDGLETCRRIRSSPNLRFIKIVLVSGRGSVEERLAGYEAGADDYVIKPFDHQELLAKTRVYMQLNFSEEMDRLKTEFLTLLGHETRTPLTHIMGAVDLLRSCADSSGDTEKLALDWIRQGCRRLMDLFNTSMQIVSFQAGGEEPSPEQLDLRVLTSMVVARQAAAEPSARIEIVAGQALEATVDASWVSSFLDALLTDALEQPGDRRVEIELTVSGPDILMCVRDSRPAPGPGDLERRLRLLDCPDVKHHSSPIQLSLPLAAAIVHALGGDITGDSREGWGAEFRVRLPRTATRAGSAVEEAAPDQAAL